MGVAPSVTLPEVNISDLSSLLLGCISASEKEEEPVKYNKKSKKAMLRTPPQNGNKKKSKKDSRTPQYDDPTSKANEQQQQQQTGPEVAQPRVLDPDIVVIPGPQEPESSPRVRNRSKSRQEDAPEEVSSRLGSSTVNSALKADGKRSRLTEEEVLKVCEWEFETEKGMKLDIPGLDDTPTKYFQGATSDEEGVASAKEIRQKVDKLMGEFIKKYKEAVDYTDDVKKGNFELEAKRLVITYTSMVRRYRAIHRLYPHYERAHGPGFGARHRYVKYKFSTLTNRLNVLYTEMSDLGVYRVEHEWYQGSSRDRVLPVIEAPDVLHHRTENDGVEERPEGYISPDMDEGASYRASKTSHGRNGSSSHHKKEIYKSRRKSELRNAGFSSELIAQIVEEELQINRHEESEADDVFEVRSVSGSQQRQQEPKERPAKSLDPEKQAIEERAEQIEKLAQAYREDNKKQPAPKSTIKREARQLLIQLDPYNIDPNELTEEMNALDILVAFGMAIFKKNKHAYPFKIRDREMRSGLYEALDEFREADPAEWKEYEDTVRVAAQMNGVNLQPTPPLNGGDFNAGQAPSASSSSKGHKLRPEAPAFEPGKKFPDMSKPPPPLGVPLPGTSGPKRSKESTPEEAARKYGARAKDRNYYNRYDFPSDGYIKKPYRHEYEYDQHSYDETEDRWAGWPDGQADQEPRENKYERKGRKEHKEPRYHPPGKAGKAGNKGGERSSGQGRQDARGGAQGGDPPDPSSSSTTTESSEPPPHPPGYREKKKKKKKKRKRGRRSRSRSRDRGRYRGGSYRGSRMYRPYDAFSSPEDSSTSSDTNEDSSGIEEDILPNSWYLKNFKGPWRVVPLPAQKKSDRRKPITAKIDDVFNGDIRKYPKWRTWVIANIHRSPTGWTYKYQALLNCINQKNPLLSDMVPALDWSPESYWRLITNLEERYGGEERQIMVTREELEELPNMTSQDYKALEKIFHKAKRLYELIYKLGRFSETENRAIFTEVNTKLHESWRIEYQSHLRMIQNARGKKVRSGLPSLLQFMRNKIKDFYDNEIWINSHTSKKPKPKFGYKASAHYAKADSNASSDDEAKSAGEESVEKVIANFLARTKKEQPEEYAKLQTAVANVNIDKSVGTEKSADNHCDACGQQHYFIKCEKFKAMTLKEKMEILKKGKRCILCFSNKHFVRDCKSPKRCTSCKRKHHTLLHHDEKVKLFTTAIEEDPESEESNHNGKFEDQDSAIEDVAVNLVKTKGQISLRILPVKLTNKQTGKTAVVNAILDDGSQKTFISAKVGKLLGLRGRITVMDVTGAGNVVTRYKHVLHSQVFVNAVGGKQGRLVDVRVLPELIGAETPTNWNKVKAAWPHLNDINFPELADGQVEMLIGATEADLMASLRDVIGGPGEPVARLSPLGWTVLGCAEKDRSEADNEADPKPVTSAFVRSIEASERDWSEKLAEVDHYAISSFPLQTSAKYDRDLLALVENHFALEELPDDEEKSLSKLEKYALKTIKEGMVRLDNGQYQCPVLWKPGEPTLPNNTSYALNRFRSFMNSKQMRDPTSREEIVKQFQKLLDNEYVEEVPDDEKDARVGWMLPMFAVPKPDSLTTKQRLVCDGSAKYYNKCLNDAIISGPCIIPDITLTLTQFRHKNIAICGDIEAMFLRIKMKPEDRTYHRFYFARRPGDDPTEYWFNVHSFGNAGSPAVSTNVVKIHAENNKDRYPKAYELLTENTHVDDTLCSFDTVAETIEAGKQCKDLLAEIKMAWSKMASNSPDVLKAFPQEMWDKDFSLVSDSLEMTMPTKKALGLVWDSEKDEFSFKEGLKIGIGKADKITKRRILQEQARLFDPLGYVSPIIIMARIIMQRCWVSNLDWDEEVPSEIASQWREWAESCSELPSIRIPRVLVPKKEGKEISNVQLHTFNDASGEAHATVIYVRVEYDDGEVYINLVASKAKLNPIKGITMPRAELTAAKLGTLMSKGINKILNPDKKYYWSDSRNVLCWLKSETAQLKVYVANRVDTILAFTKAEEWRYVNTKHNPADLASRGCTAGQLIQNDIWAKGPDFLQRPETEWPEYREELQLDKAGEAEVKLDKTPTVIASVLTKEKAHLFLRLKYVTSLVQLYKLMENYVKGVSKILKVEVPTLTREKALQWLIKEAQASFFGEEREALSKGKCINNESRLKSLRPFLDKEGILRVQSRLASVKELPEDVRFPILLPPEAKITELLTKHCHSVNLSHAAGFYHTLNELQKKYWIVKGKTLVKRIVSDCVSCKRLRKLPLTQVQGDIPSYRVPIPGEYRTPFENTIFDGMGPFMVLRGRARVKRWIIIFACMITRAVHVEIIHDCSMDEFLMCFDRFVARRGRPRLLRSDNHRSYTGAEADLQNMWASWNQDLMDERGYEDIQWLFSPPRAPHTQGSIERLVAMFKRALYNNVQWESLTDSVLTTVAVKAECMLNLRPITAVSSSPDDFRAITPDDFLKPAHHRDVGPLPVDDGERKLKKYFNKVNSTLDSIWNYFAGQILPSFNTTTMPEGEKVRRDIKVGDIVAVLETKTKGRWPVARVVAVHPSRHDGHVRVVDLQEAKYVGGDAKKRYEPRKITRDIRKLMLVRKAEDLIYPLQPVVATRTANRGTQTDGMGRPSKPSPTTLPSNKAAQAEPAHTGPPPSSTVQKATQNKESKTVKVVTKAVEAKAQPRVPSPTRMVTRSQSKK